MVYLFRNDKPLPWWKRALHQGLGLEANQWFFTIPGQLGTWFFLITFALPDLLTRPLFTLVGRRWSTVRYKAALDRADEILFQVRVKGALLIHFVWTTYLAFSHAGFWAGLVTFWTPWFSDVYWFVRLRGLHPAYHATIIAWCIVFLLDLLCRLHSPEKHWTAFQERSEVSGLGSSR